jgi:Tol biopolymer transport system component
LDDDPRQPRFIETVSTVGYRFICPVKNTESSSGQAEAPESGVSNQASAGASAAGMPPAEAQTPAAVSTRETETSFVRRSKLALIVGASVVVLCVGALLWYSSSPLSAPHIGEVVQITNDPRSNAKGIAGTDGSRIYMNLYETPARFGEVPVTGGDISIIPMKYSGKVGPLWPDGSSFIVHGNRDPKDELSDILIVGTSGSPERFLTPGGAASWSADGKQVIYAGSNGEIYTIPSSGGEPHLIRTLEGPDLPAEFAYSPDGSKVRFVWGLHRLMEMAPNGSNLHEILANWRPADPKCCGFWAPDGSFFFFFSAASSEVAGFPAYQIWALDERRGWMHKPAKEPVQLTFGPMTWLDWAFPSRDGQKIFANGENWRGELVRYNRETKQLEPFLEGISADMLDFSRDGRGVLYAPFPGTTLLRAERDGTDVQQIASLPDHPVNPRWSPDSSRIVFAYSDRAGRSLAYIVAAKGGTPVRVLPENKCCGEGDPTWSADGKQVALWVDSPEGKTESELQIVDVATHKVSYLPRPPKRTWSPRWSPDGRYIVCLTNPFPFTDGLEIYDFSTNQWKIILSEAGSGNWPSWSQDSQWIYYAAANPGQQNHVTVSRVSVDGNVRERVMDLPGFRGTGYDWGWIGLDPDDNVLLLRDAGTSEVYSLTLERK